MAIQLSVKARLVGVFGLLAATVLAVGVLGVVEGGRQNQHLQAIDRDHVAAVRMLGEFNTIQRRTIEVVQTAILRRTPEAVVDAKSKLIAGRERLTVLWEQYQKTNPPPEAVKLGEELWAKRKEAAAVNNGVVTALQAGRHEEAQDRFLNQLLPIFEPLIETTDKLVALQTELSQQAVAAADQEYRRNRAVNISIVILCVAIAGISAFFLTRMIMSGLGRARYVARAIASGSLGKAEAVRGGDEFAELLNDLHAMDRKLMSVVDDVRHGARSVGSAATELSHGNDDLSQRTQEQAAALEETAASMEEMTATVKQNADNVKQANQSATQARDQSERGGAILHRAIDAMEQIKVSSTRVADVIGVIDEIAFQTNLLALNAAVEAARAGELGRGFAVVASEVRNLAQRSASAAKETKDLITTSLSKVGAGSELLGESGKALNAINASIKKVSDIVAEISAASEEQSRGIEQVNLAVSQMDSTTQQNAALVEEAAAASKAMQQQAQQLVSGIAFFSGPSESERPSVPVAPAVATEKVGASTVKRLVKRSAPARSRPTQASADVPLPKASGDDSWTEF